MKKTIIATLLSAAVLAPAGAQNYKDSRYYDRQTGRLEYGKQNGRSTSSYRYARTTDDSKSPYIGFRIGPSFTTVSSDDPYLDGGSMKTGLNVGIAVAAPVSYSAPLYLESGLYYTEKGGKERPPGRWAAAGSPACPQSGLQRPWIFPADSGDSPVSAAFIRKGLRCGSPGRCLCPGTKKPAAGEQPASERQRRRDVLSYIFF